jgi:hypothetical protein
MDFNKNHLYPGYPAGDAGGNAGQALKNALTATARRW